MNIKEMISSLNLSQSEFADLFDLPLDRLQDWRKKKHPWISAEHHP